MTEILSANSGHCSAIPSTVLPTPCTFSTVGPSIGMGATLKRGPDLDWSTTPTCRTLETLPHQARRTVPSTGDAMMSIGAIGMPARSPQGQDNRTPGAMISKAPQCTFYSSCSLCAPDSGRNDDFYPPPVHVLRPSLCL